jgi:hypothetical protein
VKVGRAEAIDLFRKWLAEETLLRCDLSFEIFSACFRGRVRNVSDDRLLLLSDDKTSEFNFAIPEDPDFVYTEPRNGTPEDRELFGGGLSLLLEGEDTISFLEIVNPDLI